MKIHHLFHTKNNAARTLGAIDGNFALISAGNAGLYLLLFDGFYFDTKFKKTYLFDYVPYELHISVLIRCNMIEQCE